MIDPLSEESPSLSDGCLREAASESPTALGDAIEMSEGENRDNIMRGQHKRRSAPGKL